MWLKIRHEDFNGLPLHAAMSSDGQLFLCCADLARLMNFRSVREFNAMHPTVRIKDLVYRGLREINQAALQTRVVGLSDVLAGAPHLVRDLLSQMFLTDELRVMSREIPEPSVSRRRAVEIRLMEFEDDACRYNSPTVEAFVDTFREETMKLFERLSHDYKSNCFQLFSREAPAVIRVFFRDGVSFEYGKL